MAVNENKYCWVDHGSVVLGPKLLPQNWEDPNTGQVYYNINNPGEYSDADLLSIGWYRYVLNDPGAPGTYYNRITGPFDVQATQVVQTVTYEQWPIEEVRANKNLQMENQVTEITANDVAMDPLSQQPVRDDNAWLQQQQVILLREEDWQTVADFDTTKPELLPLDDHYRANQYLARGAEMTADNQAAAAAGLADRWNPVELSAWISANQPAAADESGGTPSVDPNYPLRQGVPKVSEGVSRVDIFRKDVDDPNPALRRNYAMRLYNKQDARPLYVFSYTNSTYLTWRLFEQQEDGTWYLEGTPAERQYTDTDMKFRMSYSTNPAIDADLFTDDIEFPAGVEEKTIRVRWDKA